MTKKNSDSPLTDAAVLTWYDPPLAGIDGKSIQGRVVPADFARTLERKNAALAAEVVELRGYCAAIMKRWVNACDSLNEVATKATALAGHHHSRMNCIGRQEGVPMPFEVTKDDNA